MRDTRFFSAAFAAALASMLGLGSGAAAELGNRPETYQAEPESGATLPLWLVRHKLRQRGYPEIYHVRAEADGFAVEAQDRWGRHVKLFVDARRGEVVPRAGYGLVHLAREDVERHLAALGYECLAPAIYRDTHYQVRARDASGAARLVKLDPHSGAVWFS